MIANYSDLKDKTFLVTGASSGIGQGIAIALGGQGANLVITGRNMEGLEETASLAESKVIIKQADLTDEDQREELVESLPQINGICHTAGIINPFPIRYLNQKEFDKVFSINATAPILLTSQVIGKKKLRDHSSLVFMSSVSSNRAMKGGSIYTISKAALEAFSRSITLEHANKGIRANSIRPGLVETEIYKRAEELVRAVGSHDSLKEYKSRHLLGTGTVSDVAQTALFLLSSASSWITGTEITIDGGLGCQI